MISIVYKFKMLFCYIGGDRFNTIEINSAKIAVYS